MNYNRKTTLLLLQVLVIVLIIMTLPTSTVAQNTWKFSISMGKIIPIDQFESNDINNLSSGFAESGFAWNVDADCYLSKNIAVAAKLNLGTTSMDKSALGSRMENSLSAYFTPNNNEASVTIGYWLWRDVVVGAKFSLPLNDDKIWLDVAGYGGISMTQIPDQLLLYNDTINTQTINLQNTSTTDYSWVAIASSAIRFKVGAKMEMKLNIDYRVSKAEYALEGYTVKHSNGQRNTIKRETFSIPITSFNAGIGIVYTIN